MAAVSLVMIVRDEAANLAACLGSCADLVDELVVVDTGSVDETREIAASFGARVFDFQWCDDFSAARNESLRRASGDWLFWMDADDRLDEPDRVELRWLFRRLEPDAVYLMRVASGEETGPLPLRWQPRILPRCERLRWRGRVHEEIDATGFCEVKTAVTVTHVGYQDAAAVLRKSERNLRLLRLSLEECPENRRTWFHTGGCLLNRGEAAEACTALLRATDGAPAAWFPTAMYLRAVAAQNLGVSDADAVAWLVRRGGAECEGLLARLRAGGGRC